MRGRPVRRGLPATARAPLRASVPAPALDRDTLSAAVALLEDVWVELGQPHDPAITMFRSAVTSRLTSQPATDWPLRYQQLTQNFTRHLDTGNALAELAGFWRTAATNAASALQPYLEADERARTAHGQLLEAERIWRVRVRKPVAVRLAPQAPRAGLP